MDQQPLIAKEKSGKVLDKTVWIYPYSNEETVLYCIRCEGHLTRDHIVAVIGYSETAAQIAIMLAERYGSTCCILTNGEEPKFSDDSTKLIDHFQIKIYTDRLVDIHNEDGKRGQLRGFSLEDGTTIEVNFAFVSLGLYKVYNDLARRLGVKLKESNQPEDKRRVLISHKGETSVKNFFCVGDMAIRENEPVMMQIYTVQEYAVRSVETVESRLRREKRKEILKNK